MIIFPFRLKNLVTGLIAFIAMLTFMPDTLSREWYAGPIMGALVVLIDGLVWDKKNWDVHPVIPACAIGVLACIYYISERDHKLESLLPLSLGYLGMHTLLYALGKVDQKNA